MDEVIRGMNRVRALGPLYYQRGRQGSGLRGTRPRRQLAVVLLQGILDWLAEKWWLKREGPPGHTPCPQLSSRRKFVFRKLKRDPSILQSHVDLLRCRFRRAGPRASLCQRRTSLQSSPSICVWRNRKYLFVVKTILETFVGVFIIRTPDGPPLPMYLFYAHKMGPLCEYHLLEVGSGFCRSWPHHPGGEGESMGWTRARLSWLSSEELVQTGPYKGGDDHQPMMSWATESCISERPEAGKRG